MDENTFEWKIHKVTDNRANNIMIWQSGRFIDGIGEIEESPKIIYEINPEDLYKLIEGCLATGVMEKKQINQNIFEVVFKNHLDK